MFCNISLMKPSVEAERWSLTFYSAPPKVQCDKTLVAQQHFTALSLMQPHRSSKVCPRCCAQYSVLCKWLFNLTQKYSTRERAEIDNCCCGLRDAANPALKTDNNSSHNDNLPVRGHRWGLLFSPLCGWEKTTESLQISTRRQWQVIRNGASVLQCLVTVKIPAWQMTMLLLRLSTLHVNTKTPGYSNYKIFSMEGGSILLVAIAQRGWYPAWRPSQKHSLFSHYTDTAAWTSQGAFPPQTSFAATSLN